MYKKNGNVNKSENYAKLFLEVKIKKTNYTNVVALHIDNIIFQHVKNLQLRILIIKLKTK